MATTAIAGLDVLRNLLRSDTVASLAWLDEVHAIHEQEVLLLEVFSIKARGKVAAQTADEGLDWQALSHGGRSGKVSGHWGYGSCC
jgi:hypothetical protein